jgi:hypothetical protein
MCPDFAILFLVKTRGVVSQDPLPSESEANAFRIVVIYDSTESRREAAHASAVLLRELGDDVEVQKRSWETESLLDPQTRQQAASQAAQADVILMAIGATEPTPTLKQWIDDWQRQRDLNSGLLALIPCNSSESGGDLANFLYETAVSARMDFLCRKPHRF